jgi:hypothetical protein
MESQQSTTNLKCAAFFLHATKAYSGAKMAGHPALCRRTPTVSELYRISIKQTRTNVYQVWAQTEQEAFDLFSEGKATTIKDEDAVYEPGAEVSVELVKNWISSLEI